MLCCIENTTSNATVVVRWIHSHGTAEPSWRVVEFAVGSPRTLDCLDGLYLCVCVWVCVCLQSSSALSWEHFVWATIAWAFLAQRGATLGTHRTATTRRRRDMGRNSSSDSSSSWYLLENVLTDDATDELLVAAALDTVTQQDRAAVRTMQKP